jgi:hypothetical protein
MNTEHNDYIDSDIDSDIERALAYSEETGIPFDHIMGAILGGVEELYYGL